MHSLSFRPRKNQPKWVFLHLPESVQSHSPDRELKKGMKKWSMNDSWNYVIFLLKCCLARAAGLLLKWVCTKTRVFRTSVQLPPRRPMNWHQLCPPRIYKRQYTPASWIFCWWPKFPKNLWLYRLENHVSWLIMLIKCLDSIVALSVIHWNST